MTKNHLFEKAMEMGLASASSNTDTNPGSVAVNAYEKLKELAEQEGLLSL